MKKYIYPMLLATSFVAGACSSDDSMEVSIPDDQKTPIEFMASDASVNATRAGFTGTDGSNTQQKTFIVARLSSKNKNTTSIRHTRTTLLADYDPQANNGKNWATCSSVAFNGDDYKRYWDDCFGRDAMLSIYAIAVPNKSTVVTNNGATLENKLIPGSTVVGSTKWYSDAENNTVSWKVTNVVNPASGQTLYTAQSSAIMDSEDLCYSNNIKDGGKDGRLEYDGTQYPAYLYKAHVSSGDDACTHAQYAHDFYPNMTNGEMSFKLSGTATDGPGHFDYGHMIFKHALCRITVDIKGGSGFDYTNSANFTLKSQTTNYPATVDLLKMNTSGNLDVKAGSWSNYSTSDHTYMSCGAKSTGDNFAKDKVIYSLSAQVLPGYVVTKDKVDNNFMTFNIDDNNYYVTEKEIFEALNTTENKQKDEADGTQKVTVSSDNKITLEQGKNYHFTITVNKTGINALTCTLVDWVDVEGSFAAKNSYIEFTSLSTSQTGDKDCLNFDLYRVLNTSATITSPTVKDFVSDGTHEIQYMTGYASNSTPVADMVSTASSSDATKITVKTPGTSTTKSLFTTPWYFQDNYSFYHFRSVIPGTAITKEESTGKGDYFTMYSGPIMDTYPTSGSPTFPTAVIDGNETAKYNDYHWGAIFKPSDTGSTPSYKASLSYNISNGFNSHLAGPVGPTTSTLNLIEQHMMSNIKVVLLTPSAGDALNGAVDLYVEKTGGTQHPGNVSTVNLTNFLGTAKVRMGNGLITPEGDRITKTLTKPSYTVEKDDETATNNYCVSNEYTFSGSTQKYYKTKEYTYRVVPQALTDDTNKVGLTIQTPDNNMYYVVEELANIEVSNVSGNSLKNDYDGWNSSTKKKIDRWLPGYTYTYYFILTKTGIQALTCTILDWVTVDGKPVDINLEN
ncbi:MAG: fimbrillin family protein [Prevotellaceae bacterium]|nr:fimbrillin family protein [Candidatus Minthosoma equi]